MEYKVEKIREFQPWSLNNTKHICTFTKDMSESGYIVLYDNDVPDELSMIGLYHTIYDSLLVWGGLDIQMYIQKGLMSSDNTSLIVDSKDTLLERHWIKLTEEQINELKYSKHFIILEYKLVKRYEKGKLWRIFNKKYTDLVFNYSFY